MGEAAPRAIRVRAYAPADRDALRRICHETGYLGEPAAWYWRHADSFADVWTAYYTEREPESLFVAADAGRVVGYLSGCVDTSRAPSPAWAITRADLRFGLFARPGTAGFFWRGVFDTLVQRGAPRGALLDPRWPAHLHVNLLPEARGAGVGAALMRAWFARLDALGVPGCHLGTLHENARAIAYFERHGFERFGPPQLAPGLRTPRGGRHHLQYMVRS